ncbi:MAG: hypothetical protein HYU51_07235 [Candidatus Rokubacteria bacterium]|nr:hypothetical protein [Candidatus Rokubacteria bacterium]
MSPGGHLVTTTAACAAWAALTGSLEVTAAVAVGGFLIDVDHAIDYVAFERQRDLRPGTFLRYYIGGKVQRAVLVLHSYELFTMLGGLAWWTDSVLLWGYLWGALMHLALDLVFNGEYTPRSISAFYSFAYRAAHGFDMPTLLALPNDLEVPRGFWAGFFRGASVPGSGQVARRGAPSVVTPVSDPMA